MTGQQFSVDAAREAADRDALAAWVAEFLASPGSDNAPLAEKLAEQFRSLDRASGGPAAPVEPLGGPGG